MIKNLYNKYKTKWIFYNEIDYENVPWVDTLLPSANSPHSYHIKFPWVFVGSKSVNPDQEY